MTISKPDDGSSVPMATRASRGLGTAGRRLRLRGFQRHGASPAPLALPQCETRYRDDGRHQEPSRSSIGEPRPKPTHGAGRNEHDTAAADDVGYEHANHSAASGFIIHIVLLSSTARELLDVGGKGLGAELETLDHRKVGKQLATQVRYRHALAYGQRRDLDDLATFGRQHLCSLSEVLATWRAAGLEVQSEFTGAEGYPNAYVVAPDGVRFELQEDPQLPMKAAGYHIHFFAPDYLELLDWYVDIFSGVQASRGSIETTVNVPGQNLSFATSQTKREPTQGRAIDHIGFEVDDLEAFVAKLEARGIEFQLGYTDVAPIELKIAFFTDPSGVYIELTEGFDEY